MIQSLETVRIKNRLEIQQTTLANRLKTILSVVKSYEMLIKLTRKTP